MAGVTYKQSGVDETGKVIGDHAATGLRPRFLPLLASKGIHLPADMFAPQGGKK